MARKVFIDTLFVIALVNPRDQYHAQAVTLADAYEHLPLVITDAVLLEIGNALAKNFKTQAVAIIEQFLSAEEVEVARLTPELFGQALELYTNYQDKAWGLVDCISFTIMRQEGIIDALTFDQHFIQAGFRALMRDDVDA